MQVIWSHSEKAKQECPLHGVARGVGKENKVRPSSELISDTGQRMDQRKPKISTTTQASDCLRIESLTRSFLKCSCLSFVQFQL